MYDVVFQGELVAGRTLEEVKAGVARLFKTDSDEIARLFSGKKFVIKGGVDQSTAAKYQQAMTKAGAVCRIVSKDGSAATAGHQAQPGGTLEGAVIDPPGTLLTVASPPPPVVIDISKLSMASEGVDILEEKSDETIQPPVGGDFSIAPPGARMDTRPLPEPPPAPDISRISLAPVGSDVSGDESPAPSPEPPDTSGLSIVPKESQH